MTTVLSKEHKDQVVTSREAKEAYFRALVYSYAEHEKQTQKRK